MDTLKVGMKYTQEWEVTEARTTQRGEYKIFSTPSMTGLVENTASELIRPHLKPGQGQVGMFVTVRHMASTPLGKKVRAEAELIGIDRRRRLPQFARTPLTRRAAARRGQDARDRPLDVLAHGERG